MKYSKKQILEAIGYWTSILNESIDNNKYIEDENNSIDDILNSIQFNFNDNFYFVHLTSRDLVDRILQTGLKWGSNITGTARLIAVGGEDANIKGIEQIKHIINIQNGTSNGLKHHKCDAMIIFPLAKDDCFGSNLPIKARNAEDALIEKYGTYLTDPSIQFAIIFNVDK